MRTLAIIPARGGSKRVPGKNKRSLAGTPLVAWSIRFAQAMPAFTRTIVSTDDESIASIAADEGLTPPFLRPSNLASDTASSVAVVRQALEHEAAEGRHYELVALLQPTSPVRLRERWDAAYALLANKDIESVVGVCPVRDHPYHSYSVGERGSLTPFISGGDELRKLRSQDLPGAYCLVGNLYLTRTDVLLRQGTFFPSRTAGVICDQPCEALDIDTEADWIVAETLIGYFGQEPWPRSS